MSKTPKEVFKSFKKPILKEMADHIRDIDSTDKNKEKLVEDLSAYVSSLGLSIMLRELKVKDLKEVGKKCEWDDDKPTVKLAIAKKIQDSMEEQTPRKFLEKLDTKLLNEILKALGVEPSPNLEKKKEYIDLILQTTDEMGMEKCFSSFPTSTLKKYLKLCGLKVDSDTLDTIIRALIEQQSIKAYYEPPQGEHPSSTAPEIHENISVVDLYHHFFREDLANWCNTHELTSHGSKKELVERIRRKFDNKLVEERDKKKPPKKPANKKTEEEEDIGEPKKSTPTKENKGEKEKKENKGEKEKKEKRRSEGSDSEEPKQSTKRSKEKSKKENN